MSRKSIVEEEINLFPMKNLLENWSTKFTFKKGCGEWKKENQSYKVSNLCKISDEPNLDFKA